MRPGMRGFTFPELIVVIAIVITLSSIAVVNLLGIQRRANINATASKIAADLKFQQLKSMFRDTEGQSSSDSYGVYLEQDKYTLFRGHPYSASSTSNFEIALDQTIQLSGNGFSEYAFASGSGEIVNFGSGDKTITVINTQNGEQKTITINQYGVITNTD